MLRWEAVDAGSLQAVRDITPTMDASGSATISADTGSDIFMSGSAYFIGNSALLTGLVRVSVYDNPYLQDQVLGTFFATPTKSKRIGNVMQCELNLEGTLAALRDQCTPTAYIAGTGTDAADLIRDACEQAGRISAIPATIHGGRYGEPVIYEAGTPWLKICQEAASRLSMRMSQNAFGEITLQPVSRNSTQGMQIWTHSESLSEIIGEIDKNQATYASPTRVIATYSNSDISLAASAALSMDERDAQSMGRERDVHVSVSDMLNPNVDELTSIARQLLSQQRTGQDEWSFSCLMRSDMTAGDAACVHDIADRETLTGIISHMTVKLDPVLIAEVTIRGDVA